MPYRLRFIGPIALLLLVPTLSDSRILDEKASTIDLAGIPAPYSFSRFCKLISGEMWTVGGRGNIIQHTASGYVREQHLTEADLRGVYFTSPSIGWVVGTNGTIFHTSTGGDQWVNQGNGLKDDLEAVTCTDNYHCWAVGLKGVVLHTSDGGQRWRKVNTSVSENLYSVDFRNNQIGWAAGMNGVVLHTNNGGETWNLYQVNIVKFPRGEFAQPMTILAVKFVSEEIGWVAGVGGIASTINGGKTWQKQFGSGQFIGLVSNGENKLWAIGRNGKNYYTENSGQVWNRWKRRAN
jgi:photosystem II stability/assembly factor-like uncharacterized protein